MNCEACTAADGTSGCSTTHLLRKPSNDVYLSTGNFEIRSFECEYVWKSRKSQRRRYLMNENACAAADGKSGCIFTHLLRLPANMVYLSPKNFEFCSFECEYIMYTVWKARASQKWHYLMNKEACEGEDGTSSCSMTHLLWPRSNIVCVAYA